MYVYSFAKNVHPISETLRFRQTKVKIGILLIVYKLLNISFRDYNTTQRTQTANVNVNFLLVCA